MSWVTAVPRSDDVFDEDLDELSIQNKEWRCKMEQRAKVRPLSVFSGLSGVDRDPVRICVHTGYLC